MWGKVKSHSCLKLPTTCKGVKGFGGVARGTKCEETRGEEEATMNPPHTHASLLATQHACSIVDPRAVATCVYSVSHRSTSPWLLTI